MDRKAFISGYQYLMSSIAVQHYLNTISACLLKHILISRARPTLNLPCISPQNSVTCNGQYRRPFIKAQPLFHDVEILKNCVIFSTLKHTDPHTARGRSTQKDGVCNEHIFRNGSFRELKIAKESNDLAYFAKVLPESYPKSNEFSVNRKCGQNVDTDDRRTFTDKDKGRRIQTLGNERFCRFYA